MNSLTQRVAATAVAFVFLARLGVAQTAPAKVPGPGTKPTLVVFITVDQMRGDYITRYASQFKGGLKRLEQHGALYTSAFHDHAITETAPGHATVMSGRFPVHTGIATNSAGVEDPKNPLIASNDPGASPYRFQGTVLLDWMKANDKRTRSLSVSRKDRGAILPMGTNKGDVYWYSTDGNFTTSKYYQNALPKWVDDFNARKLPASYAGWQWKPLLPDTAYAEPDSVEQESQGKDYAFPHSMPTSPQAALKAVVGYPVMDDITLKLALAGVDALQLGADASRTDLLAISLSSTDAVGHRWGPDSKELHDQILHVDQYLGVFLDSLFAERDSTRIIIALTGDHGMSPFPNVQSGTTPNQHARVVDVAPAWRNAIQRMAALHIDTTQVAFAHGVFSVADTSSFVKAHVPVDSMARALVRDLRLIPGVYRSDLLRDIAREDTVTNFIARRWLHQFAPGGSVRAVTTLDRFDYWADVKNATHGSPWNQDAWVPIVFWGKPFRTGRYDATVRTVDIAPTLADVLKIKPALDNKIKEKLDGVVLTSGLKNP
jgi:predicted AlkP superfamily pyrophosphatase or phosphodiesterase